MDLRQIRFFAVAAVLLAAVPSRADYGDFIGGYVDDSDGFRFGIEAFKCPPGHARNDQGDCAPVNNYSASDTCGNEVTTCTCTCLPKTKCSARSPPRSCPYGTYRDPAGICVSVPTRKPPCPICNICQECADEKISITVKSCLQRHESQSGSLMCLQAGGVSSHSARNLINARNSPGFMSLLM